MTIFGANCVSTKVFSYLLGSLASMQASSNSTFSSPLFLV
jgi:hypothetical protein